METGIRAEIEYLSGVVDWIPYEDETFQNSVRRLSKKCKCGVGVRYDDFRDSVRSLINHADKIVKGISV